MDNSSVLRSIAFFIGLVLFLGFIGAVFFAALGT